MIYLAHALHCSCAFPSRALLIVETKAVQKLAKIMKLWHMICSTLEAVNVLKAKTTASIVENIAVFGPLLVSFPT